MVPALQTNVVARVVEGMGLAGLGSEAPLEGRLPIELERPVGIDNVDAQGESMGKSAQPASRV